MLLTRILKREASRRQGSECLGTLGKAVGNRSDSAAPADLFRLLVHSVKDYAICLLDPGGHIASWNEGAQRIKGYSEAEIAGKHFSVFYPEPAASSGLPEQALIIAERDGRHEDEGWRVRKDGV